MAASKEINGRLSQPERHAIEESAGVVREPERWSGGREAVHVEAAPGTRDGRHRAVRRDAPERLHRREAGRVDRGAPRRHPQRAAGGDDVDPARADVDVLPDGTALGSTWSRSVPRPVTQSDPARSAIRSGASPGSVVTRVGRFVRVSSRTSPRSRWFTTHAVVPRKTRSEGPSPTWMRAVTRRCAGAIRSTAPAESSTTHTDPAPIQMLYGAWASSEIRVTTRPEPGAIRVSVPRPSSAHTEPKPVATAITGASRRTVRTTFPVRVFTFCTSERSLQATHAVEPLTARLIVGQYGPAAAQVLNAVEPGRRPDAPPADAHVTVAAIARRASAETARRRTFGTR